MFRRSLIKESFIENGLLYRIIREDQERKKGAGESPGTESS
jgi:hypothetical protein